MSSAFGVMQEGNTSLFYLRARYYDSATARFLSRDPLLSADPREINPYQYADDNPVTRSDASGLQPISGYFPTGARFGLDNDNIILTAPVLDLAYAPNEGRFPRAFTIAGGIATSVVGSGPIFPLNTSQPITPIPMESTATSCGAFTITPINVFNIASNVHYRTPEEIEEEEVRRNMEREERERRHKGIDISVRELKMMCFATGRNIGDLFHPSGGSSWPAK